METKALKVSIIIPVYNVAPYIGDCLQSVMRQTYAGSMECLLVDDCGEDDSMAIVERMIAEYNANLNANLNININFARWRSHFFSLQKKTEKTEKNRNCLPAARA